MINVAPASQFCLYTVVSVLACCTLMGRAVRGAADKAANLMG